ncbi:MAG: hypothetical protein K6L75_11260 [Cellvibrionaceae bacterium]
MRILFVLFCSLTLVACGGNKSSSGSSNNLIEQPVQTDEAVEPETITDTSDSTDDDLAQDDEADTTPTEPETDSPAEPDPSLQSTGLVPANPNAKYAENLVPCTREEAIVNEDGETTYVNCPLVDLPFLISDVRERGDAIPTIDDIISRTVVSHPWMSDRLAEVLVQMPDDLLKLFGGVTAIVIGADIRPSHYSYRTGAIYLDPASFWLTNGEKQTIDTAPDFRSAFGKELNFLSLSRYVIGNEYAWKIFPLDSNEERTVNDITLPVAYLLFHELAHANDFNLLAMVDGHNNNRSVYQAFAFNYTNALITSMQLKANQPLTSQIMFGLADVMFKGEDTTEEQRLLSPTDVGLAFEIDGAADDYSYNNEFEDTAMLFGEVMMKYHFGVDREVAYTAVPSDRDDIECSDLIVGWGYRNRIADPLVKSRAEFVVQEILSIDDASAYFANIPSSPTTLINGIDWCTNLALFEVGNTTSTKTLEKISNKTKTIPKFRKSDLLSPHQH